jgi:hypothetical protein
MKEIAEEEKNGDVVIVPLNLNQLVKERRCLGNGEASRKRITVTSSFNKLFTDLSPHRLFKNSSTADKYIVCGGGGREAVLRHTPCTPFHNRLVDRR